MTSNSHGIFFSTNTVSWKSDVSNKASPGKWLVSLAKAFGIRMRSRNLPSRVHSELCLCWQNTQLAARKHPCADTSSTNQKYRTRRGRAFQIKMSVWEHRLSHPQTSSVCGSSGSSDGQEVTKLQLPQWRPSRSCHTYHPSIEARLPCDLHQGFCSSVCSVIARPRREMGDASCLTEKMWSASVVFVSLHFWSRSSGSMFFFFPPEKNPEEAPGGHHRPDERVCKNTFMLLPHCRSTALSPLLWLSRFYQSYFGWNWKLFWGLCVKFKASSGSQLSWIWPYITKHFILLLLCK